MGKAETSIEGRSESRANLEGKLQRYPRASFRITRDGILVPYPLGYGSGGRIAVLKTSLMGSRSTLWTCARHRPD